jgi:serine/threonine protein kinase
VKDIGKGSFGRVKLVLNTENNNKPCAMKVMSKKKLGRIFTGKNKTALSNVNEEIAIMKKLVSIDLEFIVVVV